MLFWLISNSNNVQNNNSVFILSAKIAPTTHFACIETFDLSFRTNITLYIARSLPKENWINDQDRYLAPNKENSNDLLV
jgi:hypothetical protein